MDNTLQISHITPLLVAASIVFGPLALRADDASEIADLKRRLAVLEERQSSQAAALEKKTDTLADEVERTRLGQSLPEKADLKSEWGMGPSASSVYQVKQGLSLGGYGEANYRNFVSDQGSRKDQADFYRLVTYIGHRFNDAILLNSEIEFEHGTTGGIGAESGESEGEVSVEFAYLDFMFQPEFNARAGMILIPMGFINEMHEPNTFHGVLRPEVENMIIPTTWRENGFGAFGETEAGGKLEYRTYLVNGLRASRFSSKGIRDSRQRGNRALFEDVAWTGRVDYSPEVLTGLLVGGSFWLGDSGQDEEFAGEKPDAFTSILDAHAQWHFRDFEFRALGAWGEIDDTDVLSTALEQNISGSFSGWYTEAAYNILPFFDAGEQYLAPFVRFESYDVQEEAASGFTADESLDKRVLTAGLSYRPVPAVVLKLDYRNFMTDGWSKTADEVAFGIGFAY